MRPHKFLQGRRGGRAEERRGSQDAPQPRQITTLPCPPPASAPQVISGPLFPESWVELDEEVGRLEAAGAALLPPTAPAAVKVAIDARGAAT